MSVMTRKKEDGNNRLWQVDLTLTSDNDLQLQTIREHIREETFSYEEGWYRLSNLLIKLDQFDEAQQICKTMLEQKPRQREEANIYHTLGLIKNHQGEYAEAIIFNGKSIEIKQKILSPTHPDLSVSYENIGSVYSKMNEYSKAHHPDLANSYSTIGFVYSQMGEYSKAFSALERALEINQKTLPSDHPNLSVSYEKMGEILKKIGQYPKSLSYHEKALEMNESSLPLYNKMGDYSRAPSFYERAFDIG